MAHPLTKLEWIKKGSVPRTRAETINNYVPCPTCDGATRCDAGREVVSRDEARRNGYCPFRGVGNQRVHRHWGSTARDAAALGVIGVRLECARGVHVLIFGASEK